MNELAVEGAAVVSTTHYGLPREFPVEQLTDLAPVEEAPGSWRLTGELGAVDLVARLGPRPRVSRASKPAFIIIFFAMPLVVMSPLESTMGPVPGHGGHRQVFLESGGLAEVASRRPSCWAQERSSASSPPSASSLTRPRSSLLELRADVQSSQLAGAPFWGELKRAASEGVSNISLLTPKPNRY